MEILKKKILFRSSHRGIKEMDLLLGKFALLHIDNLTKNELEIFLELLNENDLDLYNSITGDNISPVKFNCLIKKLKNFRFAGANV